jgi:hypothetical protein
MHEKDQNQSDRRYHMIVKATRLGQILKRNKMLFYENITITWFSFRKMLYIIRENIFKSMVLIIVQCIIKYAVVNFKIMN